MADTPSQPAVPNATSTATGQAQDNVQTAIANTALGNANVYSPLGSSTYSVSGYQTVTMPDGSTQQVPTYTNNVSLSPQEQTLFNEGTANASTSNQLASQLLSNAGGQLTSPISTDYSGEVNQATNAALARLQPTMDRNNSALQSQLANQGVAPGSAAYDSAMQLQGQNNNDLYLGAVATGDQEQAQLFNEGLQGRDTTLNELQSLEGGGQVTMPQFASYQGGTVAQTPYAQDVYNSANEQEQQYQSQMAYAGQTNAGLFGLGSSVLKAGLFGM